jgi:hypothetical protein
LFVEEVLKYKYGATKASISGKVKLLSLPYAGSKKLDFSYYDTANEVSYYVESPDAIEPSVGAYTVCRYAENNLSAGVAFAEKYKTYALGFPFEAIDSGKDRNVVMASVLTFLNSPLVTDQNSKKKKK